MRSPTRYITCLLLLALLVMMPVTSFAQDSITYTAPDESFTVTLPATWTDESIADQYGKFTQTDGTTIYLMRVDGDDETAGVKAALAIMLPDFDTPSIPLPDAVTDQAVWKQFLYQLSDGTIGAALAAVKNGSVYVVYVSAPSLDALTTYSPDLNQLLISFEFADATNLVGVTPSEFSDEMAAELDAYVTELLDEYHTVGASVAIVQNGEVVYVNGFGLREQEGEPVTTDTLFMIGSTSKSMTTLMMATLVDDEVMSWDQPVTEILPDFALSDADTTPLIRVRDLVNNSSGVPRYDFPLAFKNQTAREVIESLATIPTVSEYGEKFNYSNQMVATGGYVAAIAAGADYATDGEVYSTYANLMQERVFDPMGFERTTLDFDAALADANHALPYAADLDGTIVAVPLKSERFVMPVAPAGAIWSSANEMALYMQMQLARGVAPNGTQVVSEQNLQETQTPGVEIGDGSHYGMGWMIGDFNGLTYIEHGGNTGGFTSGFAFLPEADFGVLVLSNRQGNNAFSDSIIAYAAELVFGLDHTSGAIFKAQEDQLYSIVESISSQIKTVDLDPDKVTDYLGDYDYHVTMSLNDDQTRLSVTSDFTDAELVPTGNPGEFVVPDGGGLTVQFTKGADGHVTATIQNLLDPTQTFVLTKLTE